METGWREQTVPLAPVFSAKKPASGLVFQQIVAVLANMFVDQAERSYRGQREA